MLLLHYVHHGGVPLSWLLLLSGHHGLMAHLVHHSLPLLRRYSRAGPLLLLLRVLDRSTHPLLLQLHLWGDATLLRGLLHVPAAAHHPLQGTLLLIHVGPCSRLVLRLDALGSDHPNGSRVSHGHLLRLTRLVVGVRRHQTRRCRRLPLQTQPPLGVCHLLNLQSYFHRCWRGSRRGLLLLLQLERSLLGPYAPRHRSPTRLLRRRRRANQGFTR